jgi:hypothetical protein
LIAASCNIRQTVLRLIFLSNAVSLRRTKSPSDWRLSGSLVSAITSHAMAWIKARSSGGKSGLAPATGKVLDGKIAGSPTAAPALNLSGRQTNGFGSRLVCQTRLLVEKDYESKTSHGLNSDCSSANRSESLLHEICRKDTTCGVWSWHCGFLYLAGIFSGAHLLHSKSLI